MKVLGHIYVALEAVGERHRPYVVWGSILPEMSPYIIPNPLSWQEIHEEGIKVVNFAQGKAGWKDLGKGLMAHSVAYGADRFDSFEEIEKLGYFKGQDKNFEARVARAERLTDMGIAQRRVHNLLDLSLDFYIHQEYPWVVEELRWAYAQVKVEELAEVISGTFQKDQEAVISVIKRLKDRIVPEDLTTIAGLARTWERFANSLPEGQIDVVATEKILLECSRKIAGKEEDFLKEAINWIRSNL